MRTVTKNRQQQLGLGIWGLLFLLVVVGFTGLVLMKCLPIYLNQMAVARAVHDVAGKTTIPANGEIDINEVRNALQRRWDADDIKRIEPKDIRIVRDEQGPTLSYDYEAREPLFYNISIAVHFAEDVPIRSSAG